MEITMYLKSLEDAAFLANGAFLTNNSAIKFSENDAVYVTMLPLCPAYNSYTVMFSGGKVCRDNPLVTVCALGGNKLLALFEKRYSYIYSPGKIYPSSQGGIMGKLFECVKAGNITAARQYMTRELSDSLDDGAITDFFREFKCVIKDENFISNRRDGYLMIDDDNIAKLFRITIKDSLIDDITDQ